MSEVRSYTFVVHTGGGESKEIDASIDVDRLVNCRTGEVLEFEVLRVRRTIITDE